jgi:hypothetical protein
MECGKKGHFKCTKERKSLKIKIDMTVKDNLDEFIEATKNRQDSQDDERSLRFSFDYAEDLANQKSWLKENTNIKVESRNKPSTFGIPRHHDPRDIYCCYCAEKHREDECQRKYNGGSGGNMRY